MMPPRAQRGHGGGLDQLGPVDLPLLHLTLASAGAASRTYRGLAHLGEGRLVM